MCENEGSVVDCSPSRPSVGNRREGRVCGQKFRGLAGDSGASFQILNKIESQEGNVLDACSKRITILEERKYERIRTT